MKELIRIDKASEFATNNNIEVHAGHGLNFNNVDIDTIYIKELNIGHFIIGESIFMGLEGSKKNEKYYRWLQMIIGIGQDICDVKRIESTIIKFGDRFKNRIYTIREIKKCESRFNSVDSYARRFAAKEACSKALGTGFRGRCFL